MDDLLTLMGVMHMGGVQVRIETYGEGFWVSTFELGPDHRPLPRCGTRTMHLFPFNQRAVILEWLRQMARAEYPNTEYAKSFN